MHVPLPVGSSSHLYPFIFKFSFLSSVEFLGLVSAIAAISMLCWFRNISSSSILFVRQSTLVYHVKSFVTFNSSQSTWFWLVFFNSFTRLFFSNVFEFSLFVITLCTCTDCILSHCWSCFSLTSLSLSDLRMTRPSKIITDSPSSLLFFNSSVRSL